MASAAIKQTPGFAGWAKLRGVATRSTRGRRPPTPFILKVGAYGENVEPQSILKVSSKYPQSILKVSSKYPQSILKVSSKYPQSILKVSLAKHENIPKI